MKKIVSALLLCMLCSPVAVAPVDPIDVLVTTIELGIRGIAKGKNKKHNVTYRANDWHSPEYRAVYPRNPNPDNFPKVTFNDVRGIDDVAWARRGGPCRPGGRSLQSEDDA